MVRIIREKVKCPDVNNLNIVRLLNVASRFNSLHQVRAVNLSVCNAIWLEFNGFNQSQNLFFTTVRPLLKF